MPSQPQDPKKRGGQAPPASEKDRPEQNVGYDEAVKGAPLDAVEREDAVADSPLTPDERVEESEAVVQSETEQNADMPPQHEAYGGEPDRRARRGASATADSARTRPDSDD